MSERNSPCWLHRGLISTSLATGLVLAPLATLPPKAYQGTLLTTCLYVLVGVARNLIGLGLALLCAQPIRARNFFGLSSSFR